MIKFGAMYMGGTFTPKAFAIVAEESGFDSIWCGDHMQHYVDGMATLGCFAGCTNNITIGTNVLVAPFRPAVTIAKGIATVALNTERPVIAGIGVGGEFPAEFQAVGRDLKTRGAYTNEAIEVIKKLWTGQAVSYHGEFNHFDDFKMEPMPLKPPQIWVGGRSDAALQRAARLGDGYIPYLVSAEQLARRYQRINEIALLERRKLADFTYACTLVYMPANTIDAALNKAMDGRFPMKGLSEDFVRKSFLLGDVVNCAKRLADYIKAGAQHIVLGCPPGNDFELKTFMRAAFQLQAVISN